MLLWWLLSVSDAVNVQIFCWNSVISCTAQSDLHIPDAGRTQKDLTAFGTSYNSVLLGGEYRNSMELSLYISWQKAALYLHKGFGITEAIISWHIYLVCNHWTMQEQVDLSLNRPLMCSEDEMPCFPPCLYNNDRSIIHDKPMLLTAAAASPSRFDLFFFSPRNNKTSN